MDRTLVLEGKNVRLEPLGAQHVDALRECADDPALWEHTFAANPFHDDVQAKAWLQHALGAHDAVPFAAIDKRSGSVAGSTRFMDIVAEHRRLEIGWTFLSRRFWRTHVNTEMKFLMLHYAFEEWNAIRLQLKADSANERSRAAIVRLGATYEGTLRDFRIRPSDGSARGVSYYSVLAHEWPVVKERLLTFLGRSLYSLSSE